jgi:hypothetical protein
MKALQYLSIFAISAMFVSCAKDPAPFEQLGSAVFIHASPGTGALQVTRDTITSAPFTLSSVGYGANSTYLGVPVGSRRFRVWQTTAPTTFIVDRTDNFNLKDMYTYVLYDTINPTTSRTSVLRLKDDLTPPATGRVHVRFLHLARNAPTVDVTLLRTSVTPNDSVTLTSRSFIGESPNPEALQAFTPIPGGLYTAKLKVPGTQNVITTFTVGTTANPILGAQRIVTLFATGTTRGTALALGNARHY